ncbi:hypothetical protein M153_20057000557 [Pseudoloma neurophilia]|uniref:Uncharacterized protein n=1 Tax=Pseudoloma neurophilia TaxID=146866 RepID=A0A0R0LQX9_9MICR|nr:hypothetical protein M153_20057000557 [Pseudoloma neurophilia]
MSTSSILLHLNQILKNPTVDSISNSFINQSYIRLNMIHINPINLKNFKEKLMSIGMLDWIFHESGFIFKFDNFAIDFKGNLSVSLCPPENKNENLLKNDTDDSPFPKIYCIELDFEPILTTPNPYILDQIEEYLKDADVIFFMFYDINTDFEILNNDLSKSIDILTNRIIFRRQNKSE